jgi:hypothetical protein
MPELTSSTRELARRIGVTETALRKAAGNGRIEREPDGQWDVEKTRRRMVETADPIRSPLAQGGGSSTSMSSDATPFARLKVAELALKVEARRLALDEEKSRLLDAATANAAIDEIAGAMRDALLNWPARVSGLIAADLGVEPHLVQTVLQQHVADLLTEAADRFDPPGLGDRGTDR